MNSLFTSPFPRRDVEEEEKQDEESEPEDAEPNVTGLAERLAQANQDFVEVGLEREETVTFEEPDATQPCWTCGEEGHYGEECVTTKRGSSLPEEGSRGNRSNRFTVVSPRLGRSKNAFTREALRQSLGTGRAAKVAESYEDLPEDKENNQVDRQLRVTKGGPVIDGRTVLVRKVATAVDDLAPIRRFNKEERSKWKVETHQTFAKILETPVLKGNKLNAPKTSASPKAQLDNVQNLEAQKRALRDLMISLDIIDVLTIVVPTSHLANNFPL